MIHAQGPARQSGEDEHNLDGGPQLVVVVISITSYYTASAKVT